MSLLEAESAFEAIVDGDTAEVDRFFELCEVALSSPDALTAEEAALLLARFWSAGGTDDGRRRATQYLDFAGQSNDEEVLAEVKDLRETVG